MTDMYKQVAQTENWRLDLLPLVATDTPDTVLGGTVSIDDEGGIALHTGAMYGPVDAAFEVLGSVPDGPAQEWEDVVELSVRAAEAAPLILIGIFSDGGEADEPGTDADMLESGRDYRVRIHVRGRDKSGSDELIEPDGTPNDHVLVQVWPSEPNKPTVTRMSSAKAGEDERNSETFSGSGYVTLGMGDPDREDLIAQNLRDAGE